MKMRKFNPYGQENLDMIASELGGVIPEDQWDDFHSEGPLFFGYAVMFLTMRGEEGEVKNLRVLVGTSKRTKILLKRGKMSVILDEGCPCRHLARAAVEFRGGMYLWPIAREIYLVTKHIKGDSREYPDKKSFYEALGPIYGAEKYSVKKLNEAVKIAKLYAQLESGEVELESLELDDEQGDSHDA